ncbi:hypothetical protein FM037_08180 [Shewanella psychropiezotolerans]|uniref:Orphan protein n=1 Tax=Shewanella psychropiezotolerans TaxID=2593655 RepID=A0ABX5WVT7_9GAMM|nr:MULTISPECIES: hypothetical protein [Shewanella]MPY22476.1 hypothetical protein [Shewanella sp. YLB-07]QDO83210.1 hypothetical protein FM037_08180 [Shewanella psychropiezotolerans]
MYSSLLFYILIFFTASVSAGTVTKSVNINVDIVKNSNSAELSIEADKKIFTALYDTKNQGFNDLDMGFTISSPMANTEDYEIELMGSDHQCDGAPLAVSTLFDDTPFVVDDVTPAMSFQTTNNGLRTSQHKFTLVYPTLAQTDSEQVCNGTLSVYARLKI